jgi:hypothetical protein
MTPVRPDVRAFFRRYERAAADLDSEALTSSFWDVFLSLDASSAAVVSPQALLAALPRRKQLFEAIGSDGLELTDISEMPLDDLHTLVRTSWHLRMRNEALRDPVYLLSTFILRKDDGAWRIVLYLNHQDMTKLFSGHAPASSVTRPAPGCLSSWPPWESASSPGASAAGAPAIRGVLLSSGSFSWSPASRWASRPAREPCLTARPANRPGAMP